MSRVLILDGNAARAQRLARLVAEAGGETVIARSLAEALRAAPAARLALVAGADGLAALAALGAAHPTLARLTFLDDAGPAEWAALADAVRATLAVPPPTPLDFDVVTRDRLTGAAGYHYFRLRLDEELERAARYQRPLSLVLLDVDDLRGLNDRLGVSAGDFALAQVAQWLTAGARSVDHVGRWAGGAFAMLLPETAAGAAYGLAERLRADLAARRLPTPPTVGRAGAGLRLTISCGVASLYKDGAARPSSLIARADHALWRAKSAGRNRSIIDDGID
jgi:diguanylate cyclase (GGDEF)-like protein